MIKINLDEIAKSLANAVAKSGCSMAEFLQSHGLHQRTNICYKEIRKIAKELDSMTQHDKEQIETNFFKERFYKRK